MVALPLRDALRDKRFNEHVVRLTDADRRTFRTQNDFHRNQVAERSRLERAGIDRQPDAVPANARPSGLAFALVRDRSSDPVCDPNARWRDQLRVPKSGRSDDRVSAPTARKCVRDRSRDPKCVRVRSRGPRCVVTSAPKRPARREPCGCPTAHLRGRALNPELKNDANPLARPPCVRHRESIPHDLRLPIAECGRPQLDPHPSAVNGSRKV